MALNAATLETAIVDALDTEVTALYPLSAPGLAPYHSAIAAAVASAVVAHITAAASISVTGVTVCGAGAGTCTANGTVT